MNSILDSAAEKRFRQYLVDSGVFSTILEIVMFLKYNYAGKYSDEPWKSDTLPYCSMDLKTSIDIPIVGPEFPQSRPETNSEFTIDLPSDEYTCSHGAKEILQKYFKTLDPTNLNVVNHLVESRDRLRIENVDLAKKVLKLNELMLDTILANILSWAERNVVYIDEQYIISKDKLMESARNIFARLPTPVIPREDIADENINISMILKQKQVKRWELIEVVDDLEDIDCEEDFNISLDSFCDFLTSFVSHEVSKLAKPIFKLSPFEDISWFPHNIQVNQVISLSYLDLLILVSGTPLTYTSSPLDVYNSIVEDNESINYYKIYMDNLLKAAQKYCILEKRSKISETEVIDSSN